MCVGCVCHSFHVCELLFSYVWALLPTFWTSLPMMWASTFHVHGLSWVEAPRLEYNNNNNNKSKPCPKSQLCWSRVPEFYFSIPILSKASDKLHFFIFTSLLVLLPAYVGHAQQSQTVFFSFFFNFIPLLMLSSRACKSKFDRLFSGALKGRNCFWDPQVQ